MAPARAQIKVLLICPWIQDVSPFRAALARHGFDVRIARADFEASLRVALAHGRFDVAIYATCPGLTVEVARSLVRQHAPRLVMIEADDLAMAADDVVRRLRDRRS